MTKRLATVALLVLSLTILGALMPAEATWQTGYGNMVVCYGDWEQLYAETDVLGAIQYAYADWTLNVTGTKVDWRFWDVHAYGYWQQLGVMPYTIMEIIYSANYQGKTDYVKVVYIWKHWTGYYPKENFTIYYKLDNMYDYVKVYTSVYEQTDYSAEAYSFFPRHSFVIHWLRSLNQGFTYIDIQIWKDELIGGGTWSSYKVWSAVYAGTSCTATGIPVFLRCYLYSYRDIGSGDVKHRFKNCHFTQIIGDVTEEWRKVDLKDVFATGKAYGEIFFGDIPEDVYFEWEYFLMDTDTNGIIDLKDYYATTSRWSAWLQ